MTQGATVIFKVHLTRGSESRIELKAGSAFAVVTPPPGRVPRISKLMELALKFDGLVRGGEVRDYAELARLGHVTRARISQIMDLLNLDPAIQEELLFLPRVDRGCDPIAERHIRGVVSAKDWGEQRTRWKELGLTGS